MILCMPHRTEQKLRLLRSFIAQADLTLRSAARIVGIDNTVLTDWVNGKTTPKSVKSLENLDRALNLLEKEPKKSRTYEDADSVKRMGVRRVIILEWKITPDERLHEEGSKMIEMMDWGTDSERRGFYVRDDSMEPDLHLAQLVIVDDQIPVDPNHAVLIETSDGDRMVRWATGPITDRVYRANDAQYAPYSAAKSTVVGVVVEVRTTLPGEEEQIHRYPRGMRRKK